MQKHQAHVLGSCTVFGIFIIVLSRRKWSLATTGPPGPSMATDFVAIDGPPGPTVAAMDSPLCPKWSPINIIDMRRFATNTYSTDLRCSVHVLPKRLTGCWLEATRFLSRDPKSFFINAYRLTHERCS